MTSIGICWMFSTEHSALFRLFFFFPTSIASSHSSSKLLHTHEFPQITSSYTGISTFLLLQPLLTADSNGCGQNILLIYARAALEMGKITLPYLVHWWFDSENTSTAVCDHTRALRQQCLFHHRWITETNLSPQYS